MCYMPRVRVRSALRARRCDRVGVRELRQNLSVYLVRIAAGETLEVTDRGRPVAVLAPLPPAGTLVQRLVASGRATAAVETELSPLVGLRSRLARDLGERLQKALQDSRQDSV
jgi:prevent-host-death family protein